MQQLIPQPGSTIDPQATFNPPIPHVWPEALFDLRFYGENSELVPNGKNGEQVSLSRISSSPGQMSEPFEPGIDELCTLILVRTSQNPSR